MCYIPEKEHYARSRVLKLLVWICSGASQTLVQYPSNSILLLIWVKHLKA